MRKLFATLAVSFAAAFGLSSAQAAVLTSGSTVVQPTIDLGSVGLTASPFGITQVGTDDQGDTIFIFAVSGGELDDSLAGTIEHDGVGVDLTNGMSVLSLRDFLIDTTTQTISAQVFLNDVFVAAAPIFEFNVSELVDITDLFALGSPTLSLTISSAAAGVLTDVFGAPDLTGAQFGLAATAPSSEVPLPAAAWFMATGIAAYAAKRRKAVKA